MFIHNSSYVLAVLRLVSRIAPRKDVSQVAWVYLRFCQPILSQNVTRYVLLAKQSAGFTHQRIVCRFEYWALAKRTPAASAQSARAITAIN